MDIHEVSFQYAINLQKCLQGISNITNMLHLMRNMFDIIFVFDIKAFPKREASMERQIRQLLKVKKTSYVVEFLFK